MARAPHRGPSRSERGLPSKTEREGESPGRPGRTACLQGNGDPAASRACGRDWLRDLRQISGPVRTSATSSASGRQEPARGTSQAVRTPPACPSGTPSPAHPLPPERPFPQPGRLPISPSWPSPTPCPASGSSSQVCPARLCTLRRCPGALCPHTHSHIPLSTAASKTGSRRGVATPGTPVTLLSGGSFVELTPQVVPFRGEPQACPSHFGSPPATGRVRGGSRRVGRPHQETLPLPWPGARDGVNNNDVAPRPCPCSVPSPGVLSATPRCRRHPDAHLHGLPTPHVGEKAGKTQTQAAGLRAPAACPAL